MLSNEQVEEYVKNGYVLGNHVLDDADVEELRDELMRVIADRDRTDVTQPVLCRNISGDESLEVWQIVNIWQASDAYKRLLSNGKLVAQLGQLAAADGDDEVRVFHDQIQYKPAQKGGANWWHQDSIYWPILQPKDSEFTAWIALDDVDDDNGCMSMVPGSHRFGDNIAYLHGQQKELGNKRFRELPRTFEGRQIEVHACPVRKGQVHFHHALTWHGSPENRSGRPRRAIALHFATDRTRFDATGEHPIKPYIFVPHGEKIEGDAFPLVWSKRAAVVAV